MTIEELFKFLIDVFKPINLHDTKHLKRYMFPIFFRLLGVITLSVLILIVMALLLMLIKTWPTYQFFYALLSISPLIFLGSSIPSMIKSIRILLSHKDKTYAKAINFYLAVIIIVAITLFFSKELLLFDIIL